MTGENSGLEKRTIEQNEWIFQLSENHRSI